MSTRRDFVRQSLTCTGYLMAALPLGPWSARRAFASSSPGAVVTETPFARLEKLAAGVWAVVSTPFGEGVSHFETVCNGGIVAGRDGVLVIEAFYSDEGSRWVARQALELTGRPPTHVAVTHHHADHTKGLGGLRLDAKETAPELRSFTTPATRRRLEDDAAKAAEKIARDAPAGSRASEPPAPVLPDVGIKGDAPVSIDLGGRTVHLVPRLGHTASDVTVELEDPRVVWCGDLVWNGMFPNYVDSIPSHLTRHCEQVLGRPGTTYVPGHGDVADAAGLTSYLDLVRDVERAARAAHEKGTPASKAAEAYTIPDTLGEWFLFAPDLFDRAFNAWHKELDGAT